MQLGDISQAFRILYIYFLDKLDAIIAHYETILRKETDGRDRMEKALETMKDHSAWDSFLGEADFVRTLGNWIGAVKV